MTQEALEAFKAFKAFNFDNTEVHLWVFKRSSTEAKYNARYVKTDASLNASLQGFAKFEQGRVIEQAPYSYLAQTNENSCLSVAIADTSFDALKKLVDQPEAEHRITEEKQLLNSVGYLVKFIHGENVVYAMRRSSNNWKTSHRKKSLINMHFKNGELTAVEDREFTLDPRFDMFFFGEWIWVTNKSGFESILKYRTGYIQAFEHLRQRAEFVAIFTDMDPLIEHVGSNAIQLRRMAVVQEKSIYENPSFLTALKTVAHKRQLQIEFDDDGKIMPTAASASLIMNILLDHVLISEVTQFMYEVPDAVRLDA